MRRITFEQFQDENKTLFTKVNQRFIEEDIFWFAHSGTLLGSKRDGNLIPWDDDIDMAITMKEFSDNEDKIKLICDEFNLSIADKSKILALNNTRLISNERIIVEFEGEEFITSSFIDMMIAVPVKNKSPIKRWTWFISNRVTFIFSSFWRPLPRYKIKNGKTKKISFIAHLATWVGRLISLPLCLFMFVEKATLNNAKKKEGNLFLLHYGWSHLNIYYEKDSFEKSEIAGVEIWVTKDWKNELVERYGDNWIELPPLEKRWPHHITLTPYNGGKTKYDIFPYIIK